MSRRRRHHAQATALVPPAPAAISPAITRAAAQATPVPAHLRADVVTIDNDPLQHWQAWMGVLPNPDPLVGVNPSKDKAGFTYPYGYYVQNLRTHATLQSLVRQVISAILRAPRSVQPRDEDRECQLQAEFCDAALRRMLNFDSFLADQWGGFYYNLAVGEVEWQPRRLSGLPSSRLWAVPEQVHDRPPYRFVYDEQWRLRVLTIAAPVRGEEPPPRKLLDFTPLQLWGNRYGQGLAYTASFLVYISKNSLRVWNIFNQNYSTPKVKLEYEPEATDAQVASYRRLVASLEAETGLVVPKGIIVDTLGAMGSGAVSTYKELAQHCNEELAKLIVGQTLTTATGQGERGNAQVHMDVRQDIVRTQAQALAAQVTRLCAWICELNFGSSEHAPVFVIDTDPPADADAAGRRFDLALNTLRIPLSLKQVRKEMNLSVPDGLSEESDILEPPAPPPSPLELLEAEARLAPAMPATDDDEDGPAGTKPGLRQVAALRATPGPGRVELVFCAAGVRDKLPSEALAELFDSGVKALAGPDLLGRVPELVRSAFLAAAKDQLGADYTAAPAAGLAGWEAQLAFPDSLRRAVITRLNDDLTIAQLIARARFQRSSGQTLAGLDQLITNTAAAQRANRLAAVDAPRPGSANPAADGLFDFPRELPARVLEVLEKRLGNSLPFEVFYQLDAVSRGAAFTAWDLATADVRHIGSALADSAHRGDTVQDFADYLYDRLQARYVQQGSGLHAWHVETIYHTNLATMYNQAQADELWDQREAFPYLQVLNPDPQHPRCVEAAGRVYPTHILRQLGVPPWHFNCGSYVAAVTRDTIQREGLVIQTGPPLAPPEVYGGPTDPATGFPVGTDEPFGAWAPLAERYQALTFSRGGTL